MTRFLLGAVALVALTAPVAAADLAARPYIKAPAMIAAVYDWSGFYVGANGGWGSSRKCWDATTPAGVFVTSEGCHDATGGVAGGQIGYRWQASNWVFGLEAQGNWADLKGRNRSLVSPFVDNQSKINSFGLFTGQVGYAANNVLFYAKGGAAVVSDRFTTFNTGTDVAISLTTNDTRWGGVAGVGLEYGFAPNWSAAVEYDHLFIQDRGYAILNNGLCCGVAGTVQDNVRVKQDVDLVTVRVNYRWGGPVIAKY